MNDDINYMGFDSLGMPRWSIWGSQYEKPVKPTQEEVENLVENEIDASILDCEKCGEEVGSSLVGDESFNLCKSCGYVTNP